MSESTASAARPSRRPLVDVEDDLLDAVDLAALEPDVSAEDGAHFVDQTVAIVDPLCVTGDAIEQGPVAARHVGHDNSHAPTPRPVEDPFVHAPNVDRCGLEGQSRTALASARRGPGHLHDRQMVGEQPLILRSWERFSGQDAGRLDG